MGYTPGYLNAYIYGPTVVYGTGFYYNPWFNGFYYPRPWSWGFGFGYNPYVGWSLGFGYGFGWFHGGWGMGWHGGWGGWRGGWWGPAAYHPAYAWNRYRSTGFYGPGFARNRNVFINSNHTNIYASRPGVITRDNHNFAQRNFSRPGGPTINGGRPGGPVNGGRPGTTNNVFSDRAGNVYQHNQTTNQWQQRTTTNSWRPVQGNTQTQQNLNRQQQMRDRGQVRTQNFNQAHGVSRPSGGGARPSGGGGRPSGGGGGSRGGRH